MHVQVMLECMPQTMSMSAGELQEAPAAATTATTTTAAVTNTVPNTRTKNTVIVSDSGSVNVNVVGSAGSGSAVGSPQATHPRFMTWTPPVARGMCTPGALHGAC